MKTQYYDRKGITPKQKLQLDILTLVVCDHYLIDCFLLIKGERAGVYPEARQMCLYFSVMMNICNPTFIASFYGKDRTLVYKSIKKINELLSINDFSTKYSIETITQKLNP